MAGTAVLLRSVGDEDGGCARGRRSAETMSGDATRRFPKECRET